MEDMDRSQNVQVPSQEFSAETAPPDQGKTRTFTANLFINNLVHRVYRSIIIQILLAVLFFWAGLFGINWLTNSTNAENNLNILRDTFVTLHDQSCSFLNEPQTVLAFKEAYGQNNYKGFEAAMNRLNARSFIGNHVILSGSDGSLFWSNFPAEQLTDYLLDYNRAICHNVKNSKSNEIYTAVYFDTGTYSDYMFVKPVYESDCLQGYISLFLNGTDWSFYLSDNNFDGVIVDERQNVIYRSKAGFANQSGKFKPKQGIVCEYDHERYWTLSEELPEYSVTIWSLVYYPDNNTLLFGLIVIVLLGITWYFIAKWMSRTMAEYNASQISSLVKEIRMIQDGAYKHRIHMNTNDEFDEVAHRINRMLDSVRELNSRNMELAMLNSTLEMGRLEAQMNPHFLYNTLEIIRNLLIMDTDVAEVMIDKLVRILRYSVDNTQRDVHLLEDMDYIDDYLYIQKVRYGDRFNCDIHLPEACYSCMVPKLILQPLIENSIKYGFRNQMNVHVQIMGTIEDKILHLCVSDNGPGVSEDQEAFLNKTLLQEDYRGKSLGLHNIARRLVLQYGKNSGMQIRNLPEGGFEVLLLIEQK